MASIQQLRGLFGGQSDAETIKLASQQLGLSPVDIADELGFGSTGGKNTQRMSASVDSYQANLYGVGEAVSGAVGIRGAQDFFGNRRRANEAEADIAQQRAKNMGSVDAFKDVHSASDFGDYAVGLGIQSLPYAAEAMVGGLGGRMIAGAGRAALGGSLGVVGASYPSSVGDILSNQREQAGGQTDLLSAAALGVPYAGANVVGVEGALARGQLFRNGIKALDGVPGIAGGAARMASSGVRTGVEEAGNETFQEFMNQAGRMAVDPNATFFNPESNDRFKESGIGGAVLGAATGGLLGGWRREHTHTNVPANLLPDAAPPQQQYTSPDTLTNTPVTEMPGFAGRQQDPLQTALNPGPSVDINSNAPPVTPAPVIPPTDSQTRSKSNQPTEEPVTPEERQTAFDKYRVETQLENGSDEGHWRAFGRDFFNRPDLDKALDKQAIEDRSKDPGLSEFEKTLNAEGPAFLRPAKLNELATSLYGSTPEKTAYNLDAAIKGGNKESDRLAAVYEKLTGQESPAWKALQQPKEKPTAAPKPAAPAAAPAATEKVAPTAPTFEDDDFESMARATLSKLFNGSEQNVEIALADLRGTKPAEIQKQYGVSDSQVRKIRSRMAPKALEAAARQAGVPLDKLQQAFAKKDESESAQDQAVLAPEEVGETPLSSDDRPLAQKTDEELTADQKESDAFGSGLSVRTGSATQVADASTRNNSRAKLEAASGNLMSKSLTPADLNNLWEEARKNEDDKTQLAVEREVLRRNRAGELSQADLEDLAGESHGVSAPDEESAPDGGQPVRASRASTGQGAAVRQERTTVQAAGKKEPKGKIGAAWDKVVRQVGQAKVEVPGWDTLTPDQKNKATDTIALSGKLTLHDMQSILGQKEKPKQIVVPKTEVAAPKIDEKSAATVAKIQRSKAPSTKDASGKDFMAKLNEAAAKKKAEAQDKPNADAMYGGGMSKTAAADTNPQAFAYQMEKDGVDMDKIRLATGWFRGPYDKGWRYELADDKAKLNDWDKVPESKLFEKAQEVELGSVLDHPQLYKAYPDARKIKLVKQKGLFDFGGLQGWFNGKDQIGITPYAKDPLSTLLHEVQHWIQQKEGFATGGNENMVFEALTPEQKKKVAQKVLPPLEERLQREANDIRSLRQAAKMLDWPEVKTAATTHAAFGAAVKADDREAISAAMKPMDAADTAVRNRLGSELGLPTKQISPSYSRVDTEDWHNLAIIQARDYSKKESGADDIRKRIELTEKAVTEQQQFLASVRTGDEAALKEAIKKSGQGYDLYRAIAGEIEARDTQARQKMTDEERKGTKPFTSETINPDDVIVTHATGGKAQSLAERMRDQMTGVGSPKGWDMVDSGKPYSLEDHDRSYGHQEAVDLGFDELHKATIVDDVGGFFMAHANTRAAAYLLSEAGVGNLMKGLDGLMVVEAENIGGMARGMYLSYASGTKKLAIASSQLEEDSPHGTFVLLHEIGHAADLAKTHVPAQKGLFSNRADLQFYIDYMGNSGKTAIPIGPVAKELYRLWKNNPTWSLFGYPFDLKKHDRLKLHNLQREVFAQLFSAYLVYPERVKADAPLAYRFMQRVLDDIKALNYEKALQKAKARAEFARNPVERPGGNDERSGLVSDAIEGDGLPADGLGTPAGQAARAGRQGRAQAGRQAERLINELPQASRASGRRLWTTISDAAKKGFYGAAFTWDLADIAKGKLPSVSQYMDLMGKKAAVKTHLEDRVEKLLAQSERMSKTDRLGREQRGTGEHSINKFLRDSTMQGKWGYQNDTNTNTNVRVDPEMAERFNNLSDDAQALVKSIFQHGADTLRMKQRIIKDEINNEYRERVREAENDPDEIEKLERKRRAALAHYDSILFLTANKPYTPLRRFGNYVVVARSQALRDAIANNSSAAIERMQADEDHYYVAFHETLGEADEVANRLRATGNYNDVSAFEKEKGLDAIQGGRDMMSAFDRLRNLIKTELESDPNDQAMRSLNTMISDLYLQTLAETSARKAELKRRNVAGADVDMLRAFATQGRADAHFIASLKHNGEVTDAMYNMRQQAHEPGEGKAERMRLFNEFMTRHALHMNYTEHRVQDAIMRGTSLWMLATSPAYYLQNATQTPMISIPYMAGKHGYGRSWSAVTQAYKDLGPMSEGLSVSERMDLSRAPADVSRMLNDLVAAGRIDITLDQDLGRFQSRVDNSLGHAWNRVDRKLRGMAQRVEAINRVTTAIAAYRMELARNGGNHAQATEYASKAIRVTHGDYSAFNSPRYLTPGGGLPAAKVVTQFRKFQIIQASLIMRLFNNAFSGDVSAEERAVARKALAFTLAHTVAMGGVYGLPGASVIAYLAAKLLGDPEEPDDDEMKMRRLIGNQDLADLILKGVPAYMGVDLSGKLGMGTAFSAVPYAKLDSPKEQDNYKNALLGLTGPFLGGLLPRFANGVDEIERGAWYKGLENLLPSGFGNAMKAYRYNDEGVTRKNGDVVMDKDEINFATEMFQAMGLQTKQLTDRTFDQKVMTEFEQFYTDKASRLTEKYMRASKQGDTEALAAARTQWMELQDARTANGFKRQPLSELLKAPIAQARRERQVVNHVGARSSRQLAEELGNI